MTKADLFVFAVPIFFVLIVGVGVYYLLRIRKASQASWSSLINRLEKVDRYGIAQVALDIVDESGQPREFGDSEIDPSNIWNLIGGLEGLEVMEKNCDVLIDLAAYVQRWHPEAVVVAEELHLNARQLKWHVGRLKGAQETGNLSSSFPFYAQRAVATYYLMTRHLLALYEQGNLAELAQLQAVL